MALLRRADRRRTGCSLWVMGSAVSSGSNVPNGCSMTDCTDRSAHGHLLLSVRHPGTHDRPLSDLLRCGRSLSCLPFIKPFTRSKNSRTAEPCRVWLHPEIEITERSVPRVESGPGPGHGTAGQVRQRRSGHAAYQAGHESRLAVSGGAGGPGQISLFNLAMPSSVRQFLARPGPRSENRCQ